MTIHYDYPLRPYSDQMLSRCTCEGHEKGQYHFQDCPRYVSLDEIATEQTILFGAPNEEASEDALDHLIDTSTCLDCGKEDARCTCSPTSERHTLDDYGLGPSDRHDDPNFDYVQGIWIE